MAPLLSEMIRRVRANYGITVRLSDASIGLLEDYSWPGNVRELANIVERLAVIKPFGCIEPDDLPPFIRGESEQPAVISAALSPVSSGSDSPLPPSGVDVKAYLCTIEKELIRSALRRADGVVARAAELLGIGRTTLVEKMKRYEISIESRH